GGRMLAAVGFGGVAEKRRTLDDEMLEELEELLIQTDIGVETALRVAASIAEGRFGRRVGATEVKRLLAEEIAGILEPVAKPLPLYPNKPQVILVVGVNGSGKTTTIGKIANQYKLKGNKVVLGAADTFRAAAVDQLKIWSERVGCEFYSKGMYTDPAAVAYETTKFAIDNNCDVAIIDTAGRLHTKFNLMKELSKIKRSITKALPGAPHQVLLVLDATTGQNAIEQAKAFTEATDVSALALTKLDGTAKGGVAIGITDQFQVPIRYIGVGEGINHLQIFNKRAYVDSLFGDEMKIS
ncbi:MAG: signal recognition particle-docking protein FtsY, partial [Bacteroidota bacterium]